MDNCSVDSEIIDSLDILRPRVKRFHERISEKPLGNQGRSLNVFRDDSNITRYTEDTGIQREASSTSLVLKKTSQREILEKYSVLSYTSLLRANRNSGSELSLTTKDKPLIKVTVIPKSQHQNKHRRRKPTQKIQATVSNHENFVHTKNLYLVVAGRKREKVYEIKTTGSAKFSAEKYKYQIHHEKDTINERSSIKQIIQSLNMDKKKKKGKTRKENTKKLVVNKELETVSSHNECRCMNSLGRENVDDRRSRVRIFGQVGLTDDERYVVKCDATVDGEPIMTKMMAARSRPPQYILNDVEPTINRTEYAMACFGGYCENENYSSLRDSNIQVDLSYESNEIPNSRPFRSMENQGTQVNFTICPNNKTTSPYKRNQTIQCNCASLPKTMNIAENQSEHNMIKEIPSPLVIISVYPKQEINDGTATKSIAINANTRSISPRNTTNVTQNLNLARNDRTYKDLNKKIDGSPNRSRTPSPTRKTIGTQQKQEKNTPQTNNKLLRTRINSPNRSPTSSNRARPIQNNERIRKTNTNPKSTYDSTIFTNNNMQKINHILTSSENKTNTEIKKALIDDYTRIITETMDKYSDKPPRLETSKVKINIDSENEYYDVQLEQGVRTTDLKIRKTQEAASQKNEFSERSDSPEKWYAMPPEKEQRENYSRKNRKTFDAKDITMRNSKLNVRDSLEIGHRREVGPSKKHVKTNKSTKQNVCCEDTDFLAPIKHYKGDSCELPDPIERDKQIRQLLGINRGKIDNGGIKKSDAYGGIVADHGLFDCFYKRDREKKLKVELSPHDLCSCEPANVDLNKKPELKTQSNKSGSAVERTSLYQQLILNRNIQVFLQVEQFTKQKPIVLSRKQYDKVKRTIQSTISKKISQEKRKKTCKCSLISVGEIRKRTKHEPPLKQDFDKQTQTEKINQKFKERPKVYAANEKTFPKDKKQWINNASRDVELEESHVKTIVLFDSKEARKSKQDKGIEITSPRQSSSSFQIHYATVGYMKRVTYSPSNIGSLSSSSILRRNESLFTIFKGRKRSVTPNLGTSDLSLPPMEGNSKAGKEFINPIDLKPKKPFLRRLMSCLVMRSRTSEVKIPIQPQPVPTTVNSSVDSYHFSTSLGAIQMGSSLYDTTASFYTSHSVLPTVNNKIKRGFFNSVREFLTSRKS